LQATASSNVTRNKREVLCLWSSSLLRVDGQER